jgi:hypothetical protein
MCDSLSYIESLMTSNKVHVKVINRCYIWTYFHAYLVMSDEVLPYIVLHYVTNGSFKSIRLIITRHNFNHGGVISLMILKFGP